MSTISDNVADTVLVAQKDRRGTAVAAARDARPFLLALAPIGLALGAAVSDSPMAGAPGWLAGPLLMSGTAQFALVAAVADDVSRVAAVLMAWALSTRLLLFSASLAYRFRSQPMWFRLIGSHFLVDQTFVMVEENVPDNEAADRFRAYWFGCTLPIALLWVSTITIGMSIGPMLPGSWRLDLAAVVLIGAMLVPSLLDRVAVVAAASGGACAYLLGGLPSGTGILAGAVLGMTAASLCEHRLNGVVR
jgi:predicted branched-subunit amino acid permease